MVFLKAFKAVQMKISLVCHLCSEEDRKAYPEGSRPKWKRIEVPLQDSNVYTYTCERGHSATTALQNPKYELLFESGILALRDGYYREAVTSFAASLERFLELIIISLTFKEIEANEKEWKETWKLVASRSELQLGAVTLLYFKELGKAMPALNSAFIKEHKLNIGGKEPVNFRNNVTHQGFIPSYEVALHYGEAVNIYMRLVLASVTKEVGASALRAFHYNNKFSEHGYSNSVFIDTGYIVLRITNPEIYIKKINESLVEHMKKCE